MGSNKTQMELKQETIKRQRKTGKMAATGKDELWELSFI